MMGDLFEGPTQGNSKRTAKDKEVQKKPIKGMADMADMAVVVTFIAQSMRDKENDHKIIDAVTATMLKDSRSQAEYLVKNDLLLD